MPAAVQADCAIDAGVLANLIVLFGLWSWTSRGANFSWQSWPTSSVILVLCTPKVMSFKLLHVLTSANTSMLAGGHAAHESLATASGASAQLSKTMSPASSESSKPQAARSSSRVMQLEALLSLLRELVEDSPRPERTDIAVCQDAVRAICSFRVPLTSPQDTCPEPDSDNILSISCHTPEAFGSNMLPRQSGSTGAVFTLPQIMLVVLPASRSWPSLKDPLR